MKSIPSVLEQSLLGLVFQERAGREVALAYEEESGEEISYGSLYTTMRRLAERGWIAARDADTGDRRVRYFKITASGRRARERGQEYYAGIATFGLRPREA